MDFFDIPGFPDYQINRKGEVFSKIKNKILKAQRNKNGRFSIGLNQEGKRRNMSIDKLLRTVFATNLDGFIPISGTGGKYLINDKGDVYSKERDMFLKGTKIKGGNSVVTITFENGDRKVINTKTYSRRIHNKENMKPIQGTDGMYEACSNGMIYSHYIEDYLRAGMGSSGYLQVFIRINGEQVNRMVHRLIAETLIPNCKNYEQVDHVDGDKTNNRVENLEWVTGKENTRRAFLRLKKMKEVM